tara:strand:- start:287 stop:514 length:228 start_codon:yes stop_codon:yes gene_type:complete
LVKKVLHFSLQSKTNYVSVATKTKPNDLVTMTHDLVVIQLAAILVASSYDNAQPVIKWGGLIVAVGTVAASIFGG